MNCEDNRFGNGAARSDAPTGNFLPGSCKPGPKLPYITVDQVDERGAGEDACALCAGRGGYLRAVNDIVVTLP